MGLNQRIREKLFAVIRAGMDIPVPDIELTDEEVTVLLNLAKRQSILPILYRGLNKLSASETLLGLYDKYKTKNEYHAIQHDHALGLIRNALDETSIPYVLLKGAVLRNLYPDITLRTSSDIDVLVREDDIERTVRVLEEKTDFKMDKRNYHDVSMISTRVHLELHFSIKENDERIDSVLVKVWDYAHESGKGSMYVFSPEYQLFHVVAHMSHHFLHGGLGIRPFLDLWLLRSKTQYEENQVQDLLEQCGLFQFYKECCHLSEVWMENAEYSDTSRIFEDFCLSGGVFGSEQFRIAGAQRSTRGWRYVCGRVFPPKYQVKEFYKDPSGKEHILPYYYVKRWRSWLSKDRRGNLNRQIKATVTSDKIYQDSADELFKRLGL